MIAVGHISLVLLTVTEMLCLTIPENLVLLVPPVRFELLGRMSSDSVASCRVVLIASTANYPFTAPYWIGASTPSLKANLSTYSDAMYFSNLPVM